MPISQINCDNNQESKAEELLQEILSANDKIKVLPTRQLSNTAQAMSKNFMNCAQVIESCLSSPTSDWLIDGIFPSRCQTMTVIGEPKHGKTWWILDLSLRLANGMDYYGFAAKTASVLYVAGEDLPSIQTRITGWYDYHKIDPSACRSFQVYTEPFALGDTAKVNAFIECIESQKTVFKPDIIIFDTLFRFLTGDENGQGMQDLVNGAEDIARKTNSMVCLLHHPTKSSEGTRKGFGRGHGSLDGAKGFTFFVTKSGRDMFEVKTVAARDYKIGMHLSFKLNDYQFEKKNGEITHTAIPCLVCAEQMDDMISDFHQTSNHSTKSKTDVREVLSDSELNALVTLRECMQSADDSSRVTASKWKQLFNNKEGRDNADKYFYTILRRLFDKKCVVAYNAEGLLLSELPNDSRGKGNYVFYSLSDTGAKFLESSKV